MLNSKTDHENTKGRKHEINPKFRGFHFVLSYFRVFVILRIDSWETSGSLQKTE